MADPRDEITPGQVASFDQAHAAVAGSLDTLIEMYRAEVADGEPRSLTIVGLGEWLRVNFTHDALAEHLTVAVARLAGEVP